MGILKALIGAVIGGAIGAGIWATVICQFDLESGWIAWIVGGLCGLGAAIAARGDTDTSTGAVAALVALISLCAGKYFAVHYIVQEIVAHHASSTEATEADGKFYVAVQVMHEYTQEGKPLSWEPGKTLEAAETLEDFPPDLRKDVAARWEAMSPIERGGYITFVQSLKEQAQAEKVGSVESEGFFASFSPLDIVFFLLALATAYKVGSGNVGGNGN